MPEPNLPSLNALKAFDAAARHGGFRAAADALNVSHGVIGRHVRALEQRIGVALFVNKNRGVELTEAGRYYHATIFKALLMISRATDELMEESNSKFVKIVAVPGLASKWLGPRIQRLTEVIPNARIVISADNNFDDVHSGDADFGIGFGSQDEFVGNLELLAQPKFFPVASPTYLKEHGEIDSIEGIHDSDCLDEDFGGWWDNFFSAHGFTSERTSDLVFSSASQVVDAALAHQGVALANPFLIEPYYPSTLMRVTQFEIEAGAYWFIRPRKRATRHIAEKCIDWIMSEARLTEKNWNSQ